MSAAQLIQACREHGKQRAFYRDYGCEPHEPAEFIDQLASSMETDRTYNAFSGELFVSLAPLSERATCGASKEPSELRLSLPRLRAIAVELDRREQRRGLTLPEMRAEYFAHSMLRELLSKEAATFNISVVPDSKLHDLVPNIVALRGSSHYVCGKTRDAYIRQTHDKIMRLGRT